MDKIKNVLSTHKKSHDAAHESPAVTSSTGAAAQKPAPSGTPPNSQTHPIYHEMTGQKEGHDTPSSSVRPGTSTLMSGSANHGFSQASIKSGVIGFGGMNQEHAAMSPQNNPADKKTLGANDAVGSENTTAGTSNQPHPVSQNAPQSSAISHHQAHSSTSLDNATGSSTTPNPNKNAGQESYTADTNRTFPLAGGVSSKHTTDHPVSSAREPGTKGKEAGVHHGQGRESLAAAAGLASIAGVAAPIYHEEHKSGGNAVNNPTAGSTTSQSAQGHHPEALAAARAAATANSPSQDQSVGAQGHTLGALGDGRPGQHRTASHPHIPGEFPSPTPDESKTFLFYRDQIVSEPGSNTRLTSGHHAAHDQTVAPVAGGLAGSTAGPHSNATLNKADPRVDSHRDGSKTIGPANSASHELRHTGTLEEPTPRSADISEDLTGRNAAIAGGIGAGVAGLGYAASQQHDTPGAGHDVQSSPYSSTALDPRVQKSGSEHHHGRDAALVGAGTATLPRNDNPSAGTTALPQDSSRSSAPLSSSTVPGAQPTPHTAEPASANPNTYKGPLTTSGQPFYGTAGAPGPIPDTQSSQTHQPGSTSSPTSSSIQDRDPNSHHGRDAALAGAGVGGLAYASHHDNKTDTGPASNTIGPHSSNAANIMDPRVQPDPSKQIHHNIGPTPQDPASKTVGPHDSNIANILDPRVKPDPAKQKGHTTAGPHQSDTLNRLDPKVDEKGQHHYGCDAAVAGGVGAASHGAYEAAKAYGDHRSTQPSASMTDQRYDPTLSGAHAPNPVPSSGHYDPGNPATSHDVAHPQSSPDVHTKDNTNRNAALGGAALGAGALGGAAYANSKQSDSLHQPLGTSAQQAPLLSQSQQVSGVAGQKTHDSTAASHPAQGNVPSATHNRYDSMQEPQNSDHTKRNAALGTAGVATAAGGGAYAYSQHQDADRERARLEKENQERLKKEQQKHDKEQHKLEKKQAKDQKEEQKEAEPEKKHGILSFLHRDKTKKERRNSGASSPRQSGEARHSHDSNPRHSKEYAAGGAVLGAGTAGAVASSDQDDSARWKGKNRLHKEPPKGHPAHEALTHQNDIELSQAGKRDHVGVDGPIGRPDAISGYQHDHGVYGAQPLSEIPQDNKVIEPHTGLPMNVGRYGEGVGGTDANSAIAHHHHHHTSSSQAGTTNLDNIKENDTLY